MIELYRGVCLRTASKRGNVDDNLSIRTSTSGNVVSRRRKTYEIHFNIFDSNSLFFSAFEIKNPYLSIATKPIANKRSRSFVYSFLPSKLTFLIPLLSLRKQQRVNVATFAIIYLIGDRLRGTSFREEERRTKFISIFSIRIRCFFRVGRNSPASEFSHLYQFCSLRRFTFYHEYHLHNIHS